VLTARPVATEPDAGLAGPEHEARRRALVPCLRGRAGPLLGVALALVLVRDVVGGRPPAGEDVTAHLIRADFALPHLVARLRPDGWFPRLVLGQQEFLFNGPGLTWLIALVRGLTFGFLSTTGALKVVCVAAVAAVAPAVGFLARSYGLSRPAAGLAAVLSLLVSSPFGPGLQGTFAIGLVSHQIGAVLFCLALGAVVRTLDGARRPGGAGRWPVAAAAATAGLLVTHMISALILAVFVALTLVARAATGTLTRAGLARLSAVMAGTAGLAAFWLVPMLAHRNLRGVLTMWDTPPLPTRLADIVAGRVLFPAGLAVLVVAGWLSQLRRRAHTDRTGRRRALVWVVLPAGYLVVSHGLLRLFGAGEVTLQLPNRGLGYAGLLAVFALAAPAAAIAARWGRRGQVGALVVAAAAVVSLAPGQGAPGQLPEPVPQLRAAAAALRGLVPAGARFATQRDFPNEISRTGMVHPELWLARVSGRNSLNGFNLEAVSTPDAAAEPETFGDGDPSATADRLARFGVSHVVITDDPVTVWLTHSDRFRLVWEASPISILAVEPRPGAPPPASLVDAPAPLAAFLLDTRAEHVAVEIHAEEATPVSLAIAWSPKWHARIDGRPTRLRQADDGLIEADIPPGDHVLRLDYRADPWDRLGLTLTALTLIAGLGSAVRGRSPPRAS
jgi:hypothetical protein